MAASHCVPHAASSWHDFAWQSYVPVFDTRLRTQWHDSDHAIPSDRATAQYHRLSNSVTSAPTTRSTGTRPLDLSSAQRGHAFHCRDGALVAASHCVPHAASSWHDVRLAIVLPVLDTRLRTQWHDSDHAIPSDRATAQYHRLSNSVTSAPTTRSTGTRPLDLSSAQRGHAFHCRNGTLVAASHCVPHAAAS